jgi:hypothetical protein
MSKPRPRCPVCGTPIGATATRGRPRVYCSDRCRWRAGHVAARRKQRQWWPADWAAMQDAAQLADLMAAMLDPEELRAP